MMYNLSLKSALLRLVLRNGSRQWRVLTSTLLTGTLLAMGVLLSGCPTEEVPQRALENVAREWNQLQLNAIRLDLARPTVQARNLFHVSAAMYEAWAAYDDVATGYLTGYRLKQPILQRDLPHRAEAISYAAYTVLTARYGRLGTLDATTPGRAAFDAFAQKMRALGYFDEAKRPQPSSAQSLGTQIGKIMLAYGASDSSNEANGFADTTGYVALNPPLNVGTNAMDLPEPNFWQPLQFPSGAVQSFLTPHWGRVSAFALPPHREGATRMAVTPPFYGNGPDENAAFIDQFVEVAEYQASMEPDTGAGADDVNISPGAIGNNALGANDGEGHPSNPITGRPYAQNVVKRGDWYRVIAEYWADGPSSETPPGHWNTIANDLLTGTGVAKARVYNKGGEFDLAYDVKLYFILNAALHDAAIACWDVKRFYDLVRPISAIRYFADGALLPEVPGVIETITAEDPLAGEGGVNVGKQKVYGWLGPDSGLGWLLGSTWVPYQEVTFITPPFPGFSSGHSSFSRAAAVVLTRYTGDPYFPGGYGEYTAFNLRFEEGPSEPTSLQWGTYYDAADEAAFSRITGGIHIRDDDFESRRMGAECGRLVFEKATAYFEGRGVAVAKSLTD